MTGIQRHPADGERWSPFRRTRSKLIALRQDAARIVWKAGDHSHVMSPTSEALGEQGGEFGWARLGRIPLRE